MLHPANKETTEIHVLDTVEGLTEHEQEQSQRQPSEASDSESESEDQPDRESESPVSNLAGEFKPLKLIGTGRFSKVYLSE